MNVTASREPPLVIIAAISLFVCRTNTSALIVIDKPCDVTYASLFCISSAHLLRLSERLVKFDEHFSIEFKVNKFVFSTSYFDVRFVMKAKYTF